jgi:hypothetical protein
MVDSSSTGNYPENDRDTTLFFREATAGVMPRITTPDRRPRHIPF